MNTNHFFRSIIESLPELIVVATPVSDQETGETDFLIDSIPAALPLIRSGRTRALATTGDARFPIEGLTQVPTLQESGMKDFSFVTWWGILAPAGTDPSRIEVLSKALDKAMQAVDLQQRFVDIGATPSIKGPGAFKTYIASELENYRKLITDLDIQAQ